MDNQEFSYTYCAQQQQEIESIRQKYLPRQEDKLTQLRRLHRSAGKKAQAWAITLGVIGALIMGTGMSLAMTELDSLIGQFGMVVGIVVGLVGMALIALAYPLYNHILNKERQRIAPEILRLTDELLK